MILIEIIWVFSSILILLPLLYIVFVEVRCWLIGAGYKQNSAKNVDFYENPSVSIIIACYNEEQHIKNKILSILSKDEWIDGSELIVVSNGSTDNTNRILKELKHDSRLSIFFKTSRSKIKAVNFAANIAKHDILVFQDCRQKTSPEALKKIVQKLQQQKSGVVSGLIRSKFFSLRSILNRNAIIENGHSMYVIGALYAQYKKDFRAIPENIIFDDLFVLANSLAENKPITVDHEIFIDDIPFENYYGKERIERLTRGLLLFLMRHYQLVLKMKLTVVLKFIVLKYSKVFLPVPVLLFFITSCILIDIKTAGVVVVAAIIVLIFKRTRRLSLHLVKFLYYTFRSSYNYFLKRKRSIYWEKLKA